jgi:F-type H+-transporting ATPase subunit b
MPEIFEKLGLNGALLISQMVNFILLLVLLKKFAYEPVLKMLEERSKKIEKSLTDARRIEEELKNTEETKVAEIRKAKEEAAEIFKKAYDTAQANTDKSIDETRRKTQEIVAKAKEEIQSEKEKSVREAEKEIADLAIRIAEKIIKKNLDTDTEKKLAEETLSKIR